MQHVPTITGDIATIKIGKLYFHLWDFAGQEQFSYLWSNFIKGSDATLLITDSSMENVEKSKFFLELIKEQAPHSHSAVIANKQDLPKSMTPEQIEEVLGLKVYSMIAIEVNNRDKMIKIIADVLEMNTSISPLLKPLLERDQKIREAQNALENAQFNKAINLFEQISDLCIDLGDDSLSKEFYEKAQKIKSILGKAEKKEVKVAEEKEPEKPLKPKVKQYPVEPSESEKETPAIQKPPEEKISENEKKIEVVAEENVVGLDLNPEDFMVKQRPKHVLIVPKDAKTKLKTSSYGHVVNPTESGKKITSPQETIKKEPSETKVKALEEISTNVEGEIHEEESPSTDLESLQNQEENIKKELMDLKLKKAKISKMELDFEMKELSGEITAEELNEKKQRLETLKTNVSQQIEEMEKLIKD